MKLIFRVPLGLLLALCAFAPVSLAGTEDARRLEQVQQLQSRLKYQD